MHPFSPADLAFGQVKEMTTIESTGERVGNGLLLNFLEKMCTIKCGAELLTDSCLQALHLVITLIDGFDDQVQRTEKFGAHM